MGAFQRVYAADGSGPMDGVADDLKDFRLIVDREFFVAGLEVENASVAAEEAAAGAETHTAQKTGYGALRHLPFSFENVRCFFCSRKG